MKTSINYSFDSSTINKEDLEAASKELWAILLPTIQYMSQKDQEVVELAFMTMVDAHKEQRRKSGEYYIIHPVSACLILSKIGIGKTTLAACLLHDVPEDTEVTLKDLSKIFSPEIVFLVEGVTKLSKVRYQGNKEYVDNLQRMFIAMSKDLRVILIKLADRLHNLRTLNHVKPEKQTRIALESVEIYAPIAERLGISFLRGEIEDAAFPYLYPTEYQQYISESDLEINARSERLEIIKNKTKNLLEAAGINAISIKGRAKKYYSIFKKVQEKRKVIKEIQDLIALRIVVGTIEDCYSVLSILHGYFLPIPNRLKDYIKNPKNNGYQSLHSTMKDESSGDIFEFQIRTEEMNDYAEYGVAAHWAYKDKNKDFINKGNIEWIHELLKLGNEDWSESDYLKYMKLDLFQDRIFVMTPNGDPIDLPENSTPLDFAFKIHDQIGARASIAKVNGSVAKLDTNLKNGDLVEIIIDKRQKPNRDWLNFVKTVNAARHIRQLLRKNGEKLPHFRKNKGEDGRYS
jgi:GTP diphosphokinase / guanosine-3',5'-bis(diphosphate) 3'-diphosphatase